MDASYPRKYYFVSYAKLGNIPLKAGNIIATYDTDGFYYDLPDADNNIVRRRANGIEIIGDLSERRQEPTTIFVVKTGTTLDSAGSTIDLYTGYCWDYNLGYYEVFNNFHDVQVLSTQTNSISDNVYLVASESVDTGAGTLIKCPDIYITASKKIHADLEGNADTATHATSANSAEYATSAQMDFDPVAQQPRNTIVSYLHDVSSNESTDPLSDWCSTLTFTLGDTTTKTARVKDTKYSVYTTSTAGLVNGTNTTVQADDTGLILSGKGWISTSLITIPLAQKAIGDQRAQTIDTTYIKGATFTNDRKLKFIRGNGDLDADGIEISDTTYPPFSEDTDGIVNGPSSADLDKFLTGNNTWSALPVYPGSGSSPANGLVPAATNSELAKVLTGAGTWVGTFSTSSDGLVPAPTNAQTGNYLRGDGTWTPAVDTTNTAGSGQDTNMLYVVGAKTQDSSGVATYSNSAVYIQSNKLYSNSKEVVNLSDAQTLSNKSFLIGGTTYPAGTACGANTASAIEPGDVEDTESFEGDGTTTTFTVTNTIVSVVSVTVDGSAKVEGTDFDVGSDDKSIVFTTAPGSGLDVDITYTYANSSYDAGAVPTNSAVVNYVADYVSDELDNVYSDIGSKLGSEYIAEPYNPSTSYVSGNYCTYDGIDEMKLYKCTGATTGTFDDTKWQVTTVMTEIWNILHP